MRDGTDWHPYWCSRPWWCYIHILNNGLACHPHSQPFKIIASLLIDRTISEQYRISSWDRRKVHDVVDNHMVTICSPPRYDRKYTNGWRFGCAKSLDWVGHIVLLVHSHWIICLLSTNSTFLNADVLEKIRRRRPKFVRYQVLIAEQSIYKI